MSNIHECIIIVFENNSVQTGKIAVSFCLRSSNLYELLSIGAYFEEVMQMSTVDDIGIERENICCVSLGRRILLNGFRRLGICSPICCKCSLLQSNIRLHPFVKIQNSKNKDWDAVVWNDNVAYWNQPLVGMLNIPQLMFCDFPSIFFSFCVAPIQKSYRILYWSKASFRRKPEQVIENIGSGLRFWSCCLMTAAFRQLWWRVVQLMMRPTDLCEIQ